MAYSDITLTVCSDGLDPRATSLFPDGDRPSLSGGTAALQWVTNGDLSHGDLITVRTNVAGLFGEPDLRSQSLSMVGNETLVNGVNNPWLEAYSNNQILAGYKTGGAGGVAEGYDDSVLIDANSPFLAVIGAAKTSFTRHANISSSFKMYAFNGISKAGSEPGLFSWPKPFSSASRTTDAGHLCVATWTYFDYDNGAEVSALQYQSLSGVFQVNGNTKPTRSGTAMVGGIIGRGEYCSFQAGTGKTTFGYVTLVADGWVYVNTDETLGASWFISDWSNCTITGLISGAVLTTGTLVSGTSYQQEGGKNCRILQQDSWGGASPNCATIIAGIAQGIGINVFYSGTNDAVNANPVAPTVGQWHRRTVWVDYRPDADGKIMCGQKIDNFPAQVCRSPNRDIITALHGPILSNWGIEANTPCGHASVSAELKTYTDIMQCIISDSSTWAGVDYLESEPLVMVGHRTATEAQFKLSRGVYSTITGKYLYVLKDPMTPINTSGLLLSGA